MDTLAGLSEGVLRGDESTTQELTKAAIDAGLPARTILDDGLIAGMNEVGRRFKTHEIFLPDVLLAARAMQTGMDLLRPLLQSEKAPSLQKVILGTVQGDAHDIGRNLVGIMLSGAGFDVIDLGNDVPAKRFVEEAHTHGAVVVGMSALLTTTMPAMKAVVDLLHEDGLAGKIKTIVGGAPVTADFAREIGADAYGFDAAHSVEQVKLLVE